MRPKQYAVIFISIMVTATRAHGKSRIHLFQEDQKYIQHETNGISISGDYTIFQSDWTPPHEPVILESRFYGDTTKKVIATIVYNTAGDAIISRTMVSNSSETPFYTAIYGSILATQVTEYPDSLYFWLNAIPPNYVYYWIPFDTGSAAGIVNISSGGNHDGPPDGVIICDCALGNQQGDCDVSAMLSGNILNVTCAVKEGCARCKTPKLVRSGGIMVSEQAGMLVLARTLTIQ
jgi:hypothetical protein